MRIERTAIAALLASGALAGCASSGAGGTAPAPHPNRITVNVGGRPTQHLDLDPFELEWDDIEVDDTGERSATQVARWVRMRHDAALRCLRADPPDYEQAGELLQEILRRVPDSSRDRSLLAQLFFADAAYWWRTADAVAWEMERVALESTAAPNGPPLTDEEVKQLLSEYQPYRDRANENVRKAARESLKHFELYRRLRPDDKSVLDFVWKLHFFLQDYELALRWLDYVLREMDTAGVPPQEPLRVDYETIRKDIANYLAERKLDPSRPPSGRGLFPFSAGGRERMRKDYAPGR
ncbi:MAG: hypothetical protein D6731_26180 [Planctomycetota bacterium]|nr:MAG: hypothetical protein D6731_26180 [Planctomycetota bacterium]